MNIIDIAIILVLLAFGVLGAKRGFFQQIVTTLGFIIVVVLAFYLKNPLAEFLSLHLPFFKFSNAANAGSFNIMFYQAISFIILVIVLSGLLSILIKVTGLFEKILKATIILGIPSKILGFIAGVLEGFVFVFLALVVLNQPTFKIDVVNDSKLSSKILRKTPILSNISSSMVNTISDIYELINDDDMDEDTLDLRSIDVMLDHKLIKKNYVEKLIDAKKIDIPNINSVLDKYKD